MLLIILISLKKKPASFSSALTVSYLSVSKGVRDRLLSRDVILMDVNLNLGLS